MNKGRGNLKVCQRETRWGLPPYICILCLKYPSPTAMTTLHHLPHSSPAPVTPSSSAKALALPSTGPRKHWLLCTLKVYTLLMRVHKEHQSSLPFPELKHSFGLLYHFTSLHKTNNNLIFEASTKLTTGQLFCWDFRQVFNLGPSKRQILKALH